MRLDLDCIRDILLSVEEHSDFYHETTYQRDDLQLKRLKSYSHEEIVYHIRQCELSELICGVHYYDGGIHVDIIDLTPSGHKFLANIRENHIWNGVKNIAGKVGSTSLDAITQIASNVITELIKAQFGLNQTP